MGLREQMAEDLAAMHDEELLGTGATYNGAPVQVIFSQGEDPATGGGHNKTVEAAQVRVLAADVATPAYNDQVVIGGETWKVARVLRSVPGGFVLRIERNRRHSV